MSIGEKRGGGSVGGGVHYDFILDQPLIYSKSTSILTRFPIFQRLFVYLYIYTESSSSSSSLPSYVIKGVDNLHAPRNFTAPDILSP